MKFVLNYSLFVHFVADVWCRAQNLTLVLEFVYCKTLALQASFINRIVKPWDNICIFLFDI